MKNLVKKFRSSTFLTFLFSLSSQRLFPFVSSILSFVSFLRDSAALCFMYIYYSYPRRYLNISYVLSCSPILPQKLIPQKFLRIILLFLRRTSASTRYSFYVQRNLSLCYLFIAPNMIQYLFNFIHLTCAICYCLHLFFIIKRWRTARCVLSKGKRNIRECENVENVKPSSGSFAVTSVYSLLFMPYTYIGRTLAQIQRSRQEIFFYVQHTSRGRALASLIFMKTSESSIGTRRCIH